MNGPKLTAEEQAHTLAALRFLRIRVGTWKLLAKVLRFEASTMRNVNKGVNPVSINMAYRASRLACVPFDDVVMAVSAARDVPALRTGTWLDLFAHHLADLLF